MIQKNSLPKNVPAKDGEESRKKQHTEPIKYLTQNDYNFDFENEKTRKNSIEIFKYRRGSNASSEEIPNINVLTEETLFASHSGIPNKHDESKISIDFDQSRDCELS